MPHLWLGNNFVLLLCDKTATVGLNAENLHDDESFYPMWFSIRHIRLAFRNSSTGTCYAHVHLTNQRELYNPVKLSENPREDSTGNQRQPPIIFSNFCNIPAK